MKKLRITIEGKTYDVEVEEIGESSAAPAPVATSATPITSPAPQGPSPAPAAPGGPGDVPSPLSGRVMAVDCKVGQAIEVGDLLVTIEAMKMNTYIHAQNAGTVTAVHVKVGDAVEEGQALVTIQ